MIGALAILLQSRGFDFGDLLENLGKIFVLVVFLIFPILKSIAESRRKAREGSDPKTSSQERKAAQTEARRRWEELLRGEVESAPPPAPPAPAATTAPPRAAAQPIPAEPSQRPLVAFDAPPPPPPPERSLEAASEEPLGADEENTALEEIARRLRDERARREKQVRLERDATSSRRVSAEPFAVPAFELETAAEAAAGPGPTRAREPRTARVPWATAGAAAAGFDRRSELRRAVIASEVLGPALALRRWDAGRSLFDAPS